MSWNFLKDPHTYLVTATFLIAGLGAITGVVPAPWAEAIGVVTSALTIVVKQNTTV